MKPVGLPKPAACQSCPMYGDGFGYVPDEILAGGADVAIVGQAPGADEEREGRPFVGATGQLMEREYFPQGRLQRGGVHLLNILKCRWQPTPGKPKTNNLPPAATLNAAVEHCMREHFTLPDVRLIVAQGHLACQALGCPGKVTDWRGAVWPYAKAS
jgi:uracil-DNA glycosylase family 4